MSTETDVSFLLNNDANAVANVTDFTTVVSDAYIQNNISKYLIALAKYVKMPSRVAEVDLGYTDGENGDQRFSTEAAAYSWVQTLNPAPSLTDPAEIISKVPPASQTLDKVALAALGVFVRRIND